MCGIVGLLIKVPSLRPRLGELMVPMLVAMTERGPDSSGVALFTDLPTGGQTKISLYCRNQTPDWPRLETAFRECLGDARFHWKASHCIVSTSVDTAAAR